MGPTLVGEGAVNPLKPYLPSIRIVPICSSVSNAITMCTGIGEPT